MNKQAIFTETVKHYLTPIREFLEDQRVAEIMINHAEEIYVERDGGLHKTNARFPDQESYEAAINNILQYTGKSYHDPIETLFDARLPDGSRVHVAKTPCARFGTAVSIRKFSKDMLDIEWLVHLGSITSDAAEYLKIAINSERNIMVSGGTSSGKTSLLNALSAYIPKGQRIVVLEDSAELQLQQPHVLSMESKAPDRYGRGAVGIRQLFKSSLRLRPDRIIIGEIRGGEALDMVQAMTSGHGGSMGTVHADNPRDALGRIETLAMMSEIELPLHALRAQVASALDVIVQLNRFVGGKRMVTAISEVMPISESGHYTLRDIFALKPVMSDTGDKEMQLLWSGERSSWSETLGPDEEKLVTEKTSRIFGMDQAEESKQ